MNPKRVQDIFSEKIFGQVLRDPTIGQNAETKVYYFGVVIFNVKPTKL